MSSGALAVEFDEHKIDAIFAELDQCHLPGAAVGIAIGGRPVYRKGFGLASMELPVVLSPTMRMRIGSATKQFTCLAYLLLCEDGTASPDDSIGTYLPELHPIARHVSVHQLMGHVGGLRDTHDICMQLSGPGRAVSTEDQLALYRDIDDVNAAPGTVWSYNNGGYVMLSVAMERIAGRSLEEIFRERIFEPLGMHDTLLRRWDTDFVPDSATLHMSTLAGGFDKSSMGLALAGEGGIVSTVDDMLRWLAHMDAPVIGSAATWKALKTPQTLSNGASTGYGLGLMTDRYRGAVMLSHSGGVMGGNAQVLKVPAAGLDVVILVNRHDVLGTQLAGKILDACLPALDAIQEAGHGPFANGTFRSPQTGRVIQLFSREEQPFASVNGSDMPYEPDEEGVLRPISSMSFYQRAITRVGDPAAPASLRFSDFGNVDELIRMEAVKDADLGEIVGRYRSNTTGTDAFIRQTDEGPCLQTVGHFGAASYRLEPLARNIWRARLIGVMPLGGVVTFDEGLTAFGWRTARSAAITFRRES